MLVTVSNPPSWRASMRVLVDPVTLAAELDSAAPPVVLDVRWRLAGPPGEADYQAGHVPGAAYLDLDTDLSDPPGPRGRHPLPAAGRLAAALRRAGVSADRPVVAYDDGDLVPAARAWWVLRWAGHPDVRVLDGGWAGWTAAGLPTSAEVPPPGGGDFTVRPGQLPIVDAAGAAELAASGLLLDVRAAPRYRGDTEPIDPVAGHIPGAVNAPVVDNLGPNGRLRPADELRARFAALGAAPGTRVGAYCGSGVTAAQQVLALALVGIDAVLYPGSWSEWVADPSRPVAVGERPA
jgi:thiosulfate/3-mercaptopyruvate sulfurtransferase